MLVKTVRNKIKTFNSFKRWKLKKKWRFWRVFKFYFLRRKKKFHFFKTKWLFNRKRIIWHQLSVMYGKNIKKKTFNNYKSKSLFNSQFGLILCKLELRLNILLVRTYFATKLLQANFLIEIKKIKVNGLFKHKNYVVSVGDLIYFMENNFLWRKTVNQSLRYKRIKNLQYKWRVWRRKQKNKTNFKHIFFLVRKNFIFNFCEINYCFFSFIILRKPIFGEISCRNKKQLITSSLLRKIYFLY